MSPNAEGGGGGLRGLSQYVCTVYSYAHGDQINFGYLTLYLTYAPGASLSEGHHIGNKVHAVLLSNVGRKARKNILKPDLGKIIYLSSLHSLRLQALPLPLPPSPPGAHGKTMYSTEKDTIYCK
jgi:hypothetical protein